MTHQEAIEKAVKLLRLAQSSNPHEAALAASRAQEIMDRFKLEGLSADFDPRAQPAEAIEDFRADPLDPGANVETWRARLCHHVAASNECKVYILRTVNGSGFAIVGRASDAQTVRYLYSWLKQEVDRLACEHCGGLGRTYWNNFRIGCVETVVERLMESRKATTEAVKAEASAAGGLALVRVERALALREKMLADVDEWMDTRLDLRNRSSTRSTYNPNARIAGRIAGRDVRMTPTRGVLT
ncbi:MAG: DUF2786 domain-containing protein [Pedosphaera sp.]|nr:DUF2786 domain-containing protein [Pedosphaera sp.]